MPGPEWPVIPAQAMSTPTSIAESWLLEQFSFGFAQAYRKLFWYGNDCYKAGDAITVALVPVSVVAKNLEIVIESYHNMDGMWSDSADPEPADITLSQTFAQAMIKAGADYVDIKA